MKEYVHKKYTDKVGIAEEMYVQKGFTVNEIATQLDMPAKVLYDWRKKHNWEAKKIMDQNVFRNTLLALELKLEEIGKEIGLVKLTDADFASKTDGIAKLLGQIVKLRNHYDQDFLRSMVRVMNEFAVYVRRLGLPEPQLETISNAIDGFFREMRQKHK